MPWTAQHACILAIAAGLATGCAAHRLVLDPVVPVGGGGSHYVFWPPPPPTATWQTSASGLGTFGDAARRIAATLRESGYGEVRSYPIGAFYRHGFAVTTRLEGVYEDGTPKPRAERWSPLYLDASNLIWLADDRAPRLPGAGRYRTLLIAFTDLPIGPSQIALHDDEWTVMDGPDLPDSRFPGGRHVSPGYRIGVYVYEYQAASADHDGEFLQVAAGLPAGMTGRLSAAPGTDLGTSQ